MGIFAKKPVEFDRYVIPAGTYQAVCYDIWDLGLQETPFVDKESNEPICQHKIKVAWEISKLMPEGKFEGKRCCINKNYTLSLSEKSNLFADLFSWRGKGFTDEELAEFDVEKMVGKNCMLSIGHKESKKTGKPYPLVTAVSKLMDGLKEMKPENERSMPEWIKEIQNKATVPF